MEISETLIWATTPIVVSIAARMVWQKALWFSSRITIGAGIAIGAIGVLFSPTALCVDQCSKVIGAAVLALPVSIFLILAVVGICYLVYRLKNI